MLLQPTTQKFPINFHNKYRGHVHFSSIISNSLSFSSGLLQNSTFFLKQPIVSTSYNTHKNSAVITCSSISNVHSYGTVDYEKRPVLNWSAVYKKISMMPDPKLGSASVLNEVENEGKKLTKWELCRVVKELRKFRRFKYALEVYEWMNNRPERFRITTSDVAIQLDLIAKVNGILSAEQYFIKLPDALKDKRIYGSLLNAYVRSRMKEKAESLMDKMRNRGYTSHALPFNVMMTLYMNLNDHEKIESLVLELKAKNIALDLYSYNIWLTSRGCQGSLEKMEEVFEQMQLDSSINPNWTTFSTMATMYIKLGHVEKAEDCLKNIESRITGRDRMPYHYLISLYAGAGNKDEVYRVWNLYKATFINIPNMGYHTLIAALVRMDDIDRAEDIYDEWLSVKSFLDPRVGNLLLSSYVKKGHSGKAQTFFDQMIEMGGKPNSVTWEILAEDHIRNRKIAESLSCLQNAVSDEGLRNWRPKPTNVSSIIEICDQDGDSASKDALLEILNQVGCLNDAGYMTYIPTSGSDGFSVNTATIDDKVDSDGHTDGDYVLLGQLEESL